MHGMPHWRKWQSTSVKTDSNLISAIANFVILKNYSSHSWVKLAWGEWYVNESVNEYDGKLSSGTKRSRPG